LRSILKEAGVGQQGLSRSATDSARALLHVAVLQERHGFSYDAAIKTTAVAELSSPSTLRSAAQQYAASGVLPEPDTSQRGRGNPSHPLHHSQTEQFGPSFEAELLIHELVHAQKTQGNYVTSTVIRAELQQRLCIDVCRRTVRRWLRELGYRWRHKRYVGGMKPQARAVRIRQFILEYAAALKEEAAAAAKIVYFDESYIHAHQASKYGWFPAGNCDVIGDDTGKRIIILHAMTEDGLLAVPDTVASNWLNEPALTAELVFDEVLEDGQDDSDYHNTMNGAKIIAWLRNRLFPTFEHLYPGKKMYLVLDNATYMHRATKRGSALPGRKTNTTLRISCSTWRWRSSPLWTIRTALFPPTRSRPNAVRAAPARMICSPLCTSSWRNIPTTTAPSLSSS